RRPFVAYRTQSFPHQIAVDLRLLDCALRAQHRVDLVRPRLAGGHVHAHTEVDGRADSGATEPGGVVLYVGEATREGQPQRRGYRGQARSSWGRERLNSSTLLTTAATFSSAVGRVPPRCIQSLHATCP